MLQAREAVERRSWSHPQEPTSDDWWADVMAVLGKTRPTRDHRGGVAYCAFRRPAGDAPALTGRAKACGSSTGSPDLGSDHPHSRALEAGLGALLFGEFEPVLSELSIMLGNRGSRRHSSPAGALDVERSEAATQISRRRLLCYARRRH